jgi:uracil-DNA glycosylase
MDCAFVEDVLSRAYAARVEMAQNPALAPWVDASLPIPRPYLGSGEIGLVIIGQDPTVQNPRTRLRIRTVLDLDQRGQLRRYLEGLCADLGLSLSQNVYATNACKGFFTAPPTAIKKDHGVDVLEAGTFAWLPVLQYELDAFPHAAIISLGEPVLTMLVRPGSSRSMKDYWGYQVRWKDGQRAPMQAIRAEESTVGRTIHPFVHQPTLRGSRAAFYRSRRPEYIAFIRQSLAL